MPSTTTPRHAGRILKEATMPQAIPLWGVVTPNGEPIIHTLDCTQYGATYRYGALNFVTPGKRSSFWRSQQAQGYQLRQFSLNQEQAHG